MKLSIHDTRLGRRFCISVSLGISSRQKHKTLKTVEEALNYALAHPDQYISQIDPEIYDYALQIQHPILKEKFFCFA